MRKTICFIRSNPVALDSRVEKETATLKKVDIVFKSFSVV